MTLETVESLLSEKQFKSAELLCTFLLPTLPNASSDLTRLHMLMGECLYEQEEYYRAANMYLKADAMVELGPVDTTFVQLYYSLAKVCPASCLRIPDIPLTPYFQCYEKMRDPKQVSRYLQRIPESLRTPHMNLMLGQAYEQLLQKKRAVGCYQAVLEATPSAYDVMLRLVHLGESPKDVLAAVEGHGAAHPTWVEPLLVSHALMHRQSFISAAASFTKMDEQFPNTLHVLEHRARCDVFSDDLQSAKPTFEKILHLDEGYSSSMDTYGSLLKKTNDFKELQQVAHKLLSFSPNRPETWSIVSMAHSVKYPKQTKVSVGFIDKAIRLNPLYWFGYVQKGWMFLRQSAPDKSIEAFRTALQIESNVFVFTGLIKTRLAEEKLQEAINLATECYKLFPDSPVSLSLLGTCLGRIPERRSKAMAFFFQALAHSAHSIDAIAGITELLVIERKYSEAIAILDKQLQLGRHNDLIHTRLAEIYHLDGAHGKALEHYHAALKYPFPPSPPSIQIPLTHSRRLFSLFRFLFSFVLLLHLLTQSSSFRSCLSG